jgi:hypothetical protein
MSKLTDSPRQPQVVELSRETLPWDPVDESSSRVGKTVLKGENAVSVQLDSRTPSVDASDVEGNIFADPEVAAFYTELYEKSKYECRAVFDPNLQWTSQEEKLLVRKLDWHVCLWAVSISCSNHCI